MRLHVHKKKYISIKSTDGKRNKIIAVCSKCGQRMKR